MFIGNKLCHVHSCSVNGRSLLEPRPLPIGQVLERRKLNYYATVLQIIEKTSTTKKPNKLWKSWSKSCITSLFTASSFPLTLRAIFPTSSISFSIRFLIAEMISAVSESRHVGTKTETNAQEEKEYSQLM